VKRPRRRPTASKSPAACYRTHRKGAVCEVCHQPAEPLHVSLSTRAFTCNRCCLHCNPQVRLAVRRRTHAAGLPEAQGEPAEGGVSHRALVDSTMPVAAVCHSLTA